MKTRHIILAATVLAAGYIPAEAQQIPMFTHYMYNTLSVNPAYAGSRDALTITALHRSQWLNFSGAPVTQTLTMHAPLRSENLGIGLSVANDKIGPTNNTSIFADFAYIMRVSDKGRFALGLSGGVNIFQAKLASLQLDQQVDPVFQNDISNHTTPNFGFGAYYYLPRFYAGLSVPNLMENKYSEIQQSNGSYLVAKERRHYFLIAGAMLPLGDKLAFKPTALLKVTDAAPAQADITASFLIMDRLLLGAMYRTGDAAGALVGIDITQQLHLGYSFDWSFGVKTFDNNMGSHELVLRYDFIFSDKRQIHSPRYF